MANCAASSDPPPLITLSHHLPPSLLAPCMALPLAAHANAPRLPCAHTASKGSAEGQCNLGYMYLKGYGVKKNAGEAERLIALAAAGGWPEAM